MRSMATSSNTIEPRCGTAGSPTTLARALLQSTRSGYCSGMAMLAGDGKFRDHALRIVDLRDHQDLAEFCRERDIRGGLRDQRHAGALAADFEPERIAGHRALGAIIVAAGFCFLRAPGIGPHADLRCRIEPESAPYHCCDQEQHGQMKRRQSGRRRGAGRSDMGVLWLTILSNVSGLTPDLKAWNSPLGSASRSP